MAERLLTVAEVLERTNEERSIDKRDVRPSALGASIWQGMVSLPGCIPHASHVARSRKEALAFLRDYARDEEGRIPRAMSRTFRKGLSSGEGCYYGKQYAYELVSMTVRELF